jgi:hypothetical protein
MTTFIVQSDKIIVKARNFGGFGRDAHNLGGILNLGTGSWEFNVINDPDIRRMLLKALIDFASENDIL